MVGIHREWHTSVVSMECKISLGMMASYYSAVYAYLVNHVAQRCVLPQTTCTPVTRVETGADTGTSYARA